MKCKNLVFEGGGPKGIAYLGALQVLEQMGGLKNIRNVAGTSSGSMTALLLSLGFSMDTISEIVMDTDFTDFLDDSFGVIRDVHRLISHYGWHKGKALYQWVEQQIAFADLPKGITFGELEDKGVGPSLHVMVANLTRGRVEIHSAKTTPLRMVAQSVRASMSIPLFFEPITFNGDILVDGGLLENYPIRIFDEDIPNEGTMGFRLGEDKNIGIESREIDNLGHFITAMIESLINLQEARHASEADWKRTVQIPAMGMPATKFDLTIQEKMMLIQAGATATVNYFSNALPN